MRRSPRRPDCVGHLDASAIASALATNAAAPVVMADLFFRSFPDDTVERRIINISSGAAQTAIRRHAGLRHVEGGARDAHPRAIAAECSAPRFRCISLRPGIFETGMQAYMSSRDPAEFPSVGPLSRLQGQRPPEGSRGRGRENRRQARARPHRKRPHVQPHRFLSGRAREGRVGVTRNRATPSTRSGCRPRDAKPVVEHGARGSRFPHEAVILRDPAPNTRPRPRATSRARAASRPPCPRGSGC